MGQRVGDMSELVKLAPGALAVGQALPWTVYDSSGALLVRRGYVIHSDRQLERLYERGLHFAAKIVEEVQDQDHEQQPGADESVHRIRLSPFAEYPALLRDMEAALGAILERDSSAGTRIFDIAARIDAFCTSDPDACLALVHQSAGEPTAYEQTLFHGILCRLVAGRLDFDTERTNTLLAASLTANIALLRHLDKLNSSSRELSEAQRTIIRKHPLLSASAVAQVGLGDPVLLETIEQHHEHHDGSGYPAGLRRDVIRPEARILALAERYTAMISLRAYRKRTRADRAMGDILASAAGDPDKSAYYALIKELTPYPPGVIVRLANDELAVVTHRPIAGEAPMVQAIVSPKGNPYVSTFFRDCDEYRIEGIVMPEHLPTLDRDLIWGYV